MLKSLIRESTKRVLCNGICLFTDRAVFFCNWNLFYACLSPALFCVYIALKFLVLQIVWEGISLTSQLCKVWSYLKEILSCLWRISIGTRKLVITKCSRVEFIIDNISSMYLKFCLVGLGPQSIELSKAPFSCLFW